MPLAMFDDESSRPHATVRRESARIGEQGLCATLEWSDNPLGIVVFANEVAGSQGGAHNALRAQVWRSYGLGAVLFDLLTEQELRDRRRLIGVPLLGARLSEALQWLSRHGELAGVPVGLFGVGAGAAAALLVAARQPEAVGAVVSSDGRPDFVANVLARVRAPTLLTVGDEQRSILEPVNRSALSALTCKKRLDRLPPAALSRNEGATTDLLVSLAGHWFEQHLPRLEP